MGDIQKTFKIVAVISLKKLRNVLAVFWRLSARQVVCEIMISPWAQLGIPFMLTALDLVKLIASARERKPRGIFIHEDIVHRHTSLGSTESPISYHVSRRVTSHKVDINTFMLYSAPPSASALSAHAQTGSSDAFSQALALFIIRHSFVFLLCGLPAQKTVDKIGIDDIITARQLSYDN